MKEQPHGAQLTALYKFETTQCQKCGAKTRKGTPCGALAMPNGRCRFHGGRSTGPRTREGLESMRQSKITHGKYTAEVIANRHEMAQFRRQCRGILAEARAYLQSGGSL
jgi:hypothetical protein